MANIQVNPHPHIHSGKSTHKYMLDLPITTYPMAIVAIFIQVLFVTMVYNVNFFTRDSCCDSSRISHIHWGIFMYRS